MIEKIKANLRHPTTKTALKSIKPQRNFWGIFSVVFIFILPEVIAFGWGDAISTYANTQLMQDLPLEEVYYYKGLTFLFGEGSWLNLILGLALFIWLFF